MRPHKAFELLAEDSLFAVLPDEIVPRIKRAATVRAVSRGASVSRQGEPAAKLIIPVDGGLRLITRDGQRTVTAQLRAHRALNLGAVLAGAPWAYSAVADTNQHVLEIDAALFRDALATTPTFLRYLQRITGHTALREAANALRRGGLTPRSIQRLFLALEERELAASEYAFEHEPAWVLVDRGALVILHDADGDSVERTMLAPGEFYGGVAALKNACAFRLRAGSPTTVFAIAAPQLRELCDADADLARVLRLEHPGVQRRLRRSFVETGQALTQVIDRSTLLAQGQQQPVAPLGQPWLLTLDRAREVDGYQCTSVEESPAAALASLLRFHERPVTYASVRRTLARRSPPSFLDLAQIAERHGLMTHAAKVERPEQLRDLRAPFLLVIGARCVVVHEVGRRTIRIFDPLSGPRELPLSALRQDFTGQTLVCRDVRPVLDELGGGGKLTSYLALFDDVRGALIAAAIASLVVLGLSVVAPRLNALVIDQVLAYQDVGLLGVVAIGLVLIHISTFVLSGFRGLCVGYLGGLMEYRLSALTLRHTLGVSFDAHGESRVGSSLSRLAELAQVRRALSTDIIEIALQLAQGALFAFLVFYYSIKLGLILVVAVPVGTLIVRLGGRLYRKRYLELFDARTRMQAQTTEQIEQVATIKSLGGNQAAQRRWENALVSTVSVERDISRVQVGVQAALTMVGETVRIGGMYIGITLALRGELSPGLMLAVTQYMSGALEPLVGLASKLDELQQARISLRKLEELYRHPIEDDETIAMGGDAAFEGAIRARNVGFTYADGTEVLHDISLDIKPGQTVAIVGRSGSGKTTLAKLLHGAMRPTSGELFFDDQDSALVSLPVIRRNVGIVLQESMLFSGTIAANIAYGDDRPDELRVREAARLAAAHEFITALPRGYDTYLAEGGLGLSGGQRQRVCIARALYRAPRILIFDEATSSLDAESERAILANMRDILRGRTGLVIAHRINTVQYADRILVIDRGRLVEDGTHTELLARRGVYYSLFGQHAGALAG